MKQLLITTLTAVVLVGCGGPAIHKEVVDGDIELVEQLIAAVIDVNAKDSTHHLHLPTPIGKARCDRSGKVLAPPQGVASAAVSDIIGAPYAETNSYFVSVVAVYGYCERSS